MNPKNLLLCLYLCPLIWAGCTSIKGHTEKTYIDPKLNIPVKEVTDFGGKTFFDGKSAIANLKNSITPQTSGTSIGAVNQESSGSNAVQVVKIIIEAAEKAILPIPK